MGALLDGEGGWVQFCFSLGGAAVLGMGWTARFRVWFSGRGAGWALAKHMVFPAAARRFMVGLGGACVVWLGERNKRESWPGGKDEDDDVSAPRSMDGSGL